MFGSAITLLLIVATPASPAESLNARAVAERVASLVEEGRVDEALVVIEEAASTSSDPRFLYMRAALEEQLGRCGVASALYREFWVKTSELEDRRVAEAGLRRCGETPPVESAPPAKPEPPSPREPMDPPQPPAPVDGGVRWTRDPLGLSLVGLGGAGALASGSMGLVSLVQARNSERADALSEYRARRAAVQRLQVAAGVCAGVSAALLIAGSIRLIVVSRRRGRAQPTRRASGVSFFF